MLPEYRCSGTVVLCIMMFDQLGRKHTGRQHSSKCGSNLWMFLSSLNVSIFPRPRVNLSLVKDSWVIARHPWCFLVVFEAFKWKWKSVRTFLLAYFSPPLMLHAHSEWPSCWSRLSNSTAAHPRCQPIISLTSFKIRFSFCLSSVILLLCTPLHLPTTT